MFVTPPTIGRLHLRSRVWAWQRVKAGYYGQPTRGPRGALVVPLSKVESVAGRRFSAEQLAAAGVPIAQHQED
jgi:hypothetical protein